MVTASDSTPTISWTKTSEPRGSLVSREHLSPLRKQSLGTPGHRQRVPSDRISPAEVLPRGKVKPPRTRPRPRHRPRHRWRRAWSLR